MLIGFIIGLSAAFHCLGMCGPIAMAIPVNRSNNWTILLGALQYNFGRVSAYTFLGFLIGSIGLSIASLQWMQWLSIAAGLLMTFIAWHQLFHFGQSKWTGKISITISRGIGKLFRSKSPLKLLGLGVLNGLLPCGMVFIGLTNALIQTSPLQGAMAMFFYGLGTLPMMLSVVFFASKLSGTWRLRFTKIVPYLMTFIGVLVILRGLNLGIPYFSPEIKLSETVLEHESTKKPSVEMNCCTSKTADACKSNEKF